MTREELLKVAKAMVVNLEVARTIPNKTQTRRLIKPQPLLAIKAENERHNSYSWKGGMYALDMYPNNSLIIENASKWQIGDILWVREPVEITGVLETGSHSGGDYAKKIWFKYLSDLSEDYIDISELANLKTSWMKPFARVPNGCLKEMARTFLKVTNVRVEKLQDISEFDIHNEGIRCPIPNMWSEDKRREYIKYEWKQLWNRTSPIGYLWEDNPYVFVYEFEKAEVLR